MNELFLRDKIVKMVEPLFFNSDKYTVKLTDFEVDDVVALSGLKNTAEHTELAERVLMKAIEIEKVIGKGKAADVMLESANNLLDDCKPDYYFRKVEALKSKAMSEMKEEQALKPRNAKLTI